MTDEKLEVPEPEAPPTTVHGFFYRLFFTRGDDLDMLQIMFLVMIVFFIIAFTHAASGKWEISTEGWSIFKFIFIIIAITGVPSTLAVIIARALKP